MSGDVLRLRPRPEGDAPIRRSKRPKRYCGHRHVEVDEDARRVECLDCGNEVDPFAALEMLAWDYERYVHSRDEANRQAERASRDLEAVKRELRNAKARLRRAQRPLSEGEA